MKNETDTLSKEIAVLQEKQAREQWLLREQLNITHDSLKLINIIKKTLKEISSSSEIKRNFIGFAIGIGAGYLSKKILIGRTKNPVKKMLGTLMQFTIAYIVSKNADGIKVEGEKLVQRYLKSRKDSKREFGKFGNDFSI
ncbi:MAG: hypothetical protein JJU28_11985 [Cyclobacteriaceae bacterium]|nr:hypothetical protein [Cyclobacteriaceae bacterium]